MGCSPDSYEPWRIIIDVINNTISIIETIIYILYSSADIKKLYYFWFRYIVQSLKVILCLLFHLISFVTCCRRIKCLDWIKSFASVLSIIGTFFGCISVKNGQMMLIIIAIIGLILLYSSISLQKKIDILIKNRNLLQ